MDEKIEQQAIDITIGLEENIENIHTYQTISVKKVTLPDNYKFFHMSRIKRIFAKVLIAIVWVLIYPHAKIVAGYKKYGAKNFNNCKDGCILVANHCFPLDAFYVLTGFMNKQIDVLSLQSNLGWPLFTGSYIRGAGAVPIPEKKELMRPFTKQLGEALNARHNILIYPEAALKPFCDHIRPFKKGAFRFAIQGNKPIIPMVWTFHHPRGLRKLIRKKPVLHLNILEPYYPVQMPTTHETVSKCMDDIHKIMNDFFVLNSEVFLEEHNQ